MAVASRARSSSSSFALRSSVTYVVAAGNSNADLRNFVPATYDRVLTVTAASDSDGSPGGLGGAPSCRTGEKDDYPATFSNYASLTADQNHTIAAPGVCIYSTWKNGGYNTISGTSMASPHVAGAAALYKAKVPAATPAQVMTALRTDAESWDPSNGFTGDPRTSPIAGHYYGYLARADLY